MTPRYARFLAKSYLYLLALMTLSRLIAAGMVRENLQGISAWDWLTAVWLGWRFDNVVLCALLALPFLLMSLNHYTLRSQRLQDLAAWPLYLMVPIVVLLQMIDLAYFDHFNVRITVILFNWLDDLSFIVKMVKDEPLWFFGGLAMPLLMAAFVWPIRTFARRNFWHPLVGKNQALWALTALLFTGLLFLGIRGRAALKSPIRAGTAFFSPNPTLNNLALNPTYSFFASWARARKYKQKPLKFMAEAEAWRLLHDFYGAQQPGMKYPLSRLMDNGPLKDWNVALVIMEGMSAHYTAFKKNPSWTPTLDQLAQEGLFFPNTFSAGIHTYNGIWSTLFSFPSPYTAHPLKRDTIPSLNSFVRQLTLQGRHTLFFTTHDDQFDNMAGFVRQNGFQEVVHQGDYLPERVFSILGVPDHDMFDAAITRLDQRAGQGPFFAALLTGSNHKPHVIPPELKDQFSALDIKENIVRYSDWAISRFIEAARSKPWFARTLFVFIADHGHAVGHEPLDQVLSYHHVPFIIYAPALVKPERSLSPVMQVDVMPTVMGLLGGQWVNSTLGRDVRANPRSWVYVGRDAVTCLITQRWLDCEDQEKSHNRQALTGYEWPLALAEEKHERYWKLIHAELQVSNELLRHPPLFP